MIGLKINKNDYEFRIPDYLVFHLDSIRQKLVVEGTGYLFSFLKANENIEYEILIADFAEPSEKISSNNDVADIDTELEKTLRNEEWMLQKKLEEFKRLEKILKEEGII